MKRAVAAILLIFLALPLSLRAQQVTGPGISSFTTVPLPRPLRLPPGLIESLPIVKDASFFGDAVKVMDCDPEQPTTPLGLCSNQMFGGLALMSSHLQGTIQIQFYPPFNNLAHFEVSHLTNLQGDDTVMKAPQFYEMPVQHNYILDPFSNLSSGDLNLITGQVTNLKYRVLFNNDFYTALQNANPKLVGNAFEFPGGYGIAQATFQQRADGLLDFTFYGTTALPLGPNILGDPVRMPLPLCGPLIQCSSIQAPGTTLHPFIQITTVPSSDPPCGSNCPNIPSNSVQNYTAFSYATQLGDNFNLDIPQLGGPGEARSHMTGRVHIQFGEKSGNFLPFVISAIPPEGLLAPAPTGTPLGFSLGLLGMSEFLFFPKQTYFFSNVATGDDPIDMSIGELDLRTGAIVGGNGIFRSYFVQSIFIGLSALQPGIIPSSLPFKGPLKFETAANGETVFRFNGESSFPVPFPIFPTPDNKSGYFVGANGTLDLFYRLQMMHPVDPPRTVKIGSASNVGSSIGDLFSYNYSVPCNGTQGDASFSYTNNNGSGKAANSGTFKMESLVSVSCINSRNSRAAVGDYDTVTFTGFGTWSQDSQPHAATVQVSTAPDAPYVHIMIDGGFLSQANTKPAVSPVP